MARLMTKNIKTTHGCLSKFLFSETLQVKTIQNNSLLFEVFFFSQEKPYSLHIHGTSMLFHAIFGFLVAAIYLLVLFVVFLLILHPPKCR